VLPLFPSWAIPFTIRDPVLLRQVLCFPRSSLFQFLFMSSFSRLIETSRKLISSIAGVWPCPRSLSMKTFNPYRNVKRLLLFYNLSFLGLVAVEPPHPSFMLAFISLHTCSSLKALFRFIVFSLLKGLSAGIRRLTGTFLQHLRRFFFLLILILSLACIPDTIFPCKYFILPRFPHPVRLVF